MTYLIFTFGALVLLHFVYEGIIAPSLRLNLRFRLFQLRDELRMLKIRHGSDFDDKHFHYLQDGVNNLLSGLPRIDITLLVRVMNEIASDKQLKQRMDARAKILDDCKLDDARRLRKQSIEIVERALTINSGAWVLYVLPIALAAVCYKSTIKTLRSLTALSQSDFAKVVDEQPTVVTSS